MNRQHLIAVGAAALMAVAVSGCGDSPGPPEIGHASSGPITKQRVEEFARTVNLRAEDLPGSSVASTEYEPADPAQEEQLAECVPGRSLPEMVGGAASPTFYYHEGGEGVVFISTVEAARTPDELEALLRELNTASGFACFARVVEDIWRQQDPTVTSVGEPDHWRLRRPLSIGARGLAVRFHLRVGDGAEAERYVDVIRFVAGHAEVAMTAIGTPTPVDQDVEAGLVSKLAERAERHAL